MAVSVVLSVASGGSGVGATIYRGLFGSMVVNAMPTKLVPCP